MSQPEARVLVVDDEPNIVDVITMALRFQGFAVASAGTAARRWPPCGWVSAGNAADGGSVFSVVLPAALGGRGGSGETAAG